MWNPTRCSWSFLVRSSTIAALCVGVLGCESTEHSRPARVATPAPQESLDAQLSRLTRESRPQKEHRALDVLVGSWAIDLVSVGPTGAEQSLAGGRGEIAWILGGRFLHWDASLAILGRNEATTGYLGFDLATRQYQLLMISTLASGMAVARGDGDLSGDGIAFELEQLDAESGARRRMRSLLRLLSESHFVLDQVGNDGDGVERVVRRSHYRRREPNASRREEKLTPANPPRS